MTIKELIHMINQDIPEQEALTWDNVGLLVGNQEAQVHKIYIALDATEQVIEHAISCEADFIITHHPMIFSGMKQVCFDDFTGRRIMKLIEHHMACYAMHTNFDVMKMADLAADCIGLEHGRILDEEEKIGKVGILPDAVSIKELAEKTKTAFGLSHVKVFGDATNMVTRVAICPGSGKSEVLPAIASGAQVLITGDIDHHTGIDAVAQGLTVIDAGHYGIEHIFIDYMKTYLQAHCGELTVVTEPFQEPFWIQ